MQLKQFYNMATKVNSIKKCYYFWWSTWLFNDKNTDIYFSTQNLIQSQHKFTYRKDNKLTQFQGKSSTSTSTCNPWLGRSAWIIFCAWFKMTDIPNSKIPQCTEQKWCTLLLWMVHCGIWDRCCGICQICLFPWATYTATTFNHNLCYKVLSCCYTILRSERNDRHCTCALRWRHNEHASVSNHQPHDCLLNHLFGRRSK